MAPLENTTVLRRAPALAWSYQEQTANLRTGGRNLRYEGKATKLLRILLPLVDGERDLASVIKDLGGEHLRSPTLRLCEQLVADGLLIDAVDSDVSTYPGGLLGANYQQLENRDLPHPIKVMRVVGTPAELDAVARLAPAHWRVESVTLADIVGVGTPEGVCTTVWVTDPNDQLLAEWNETAYHNGQPWLPISHYDGEVAVVGPYVHPKTTPCFECYRRRRAARHALGTDFLALRPLETGSLSSDALTAVLAGLGVAALQEWETRANAFVPGGIQTVTFERGLQIRSELVLRVPRCSACRPGVAVARPTLWTEYFPPDDAKADSNGFATEETALG